MNRALRTWGSVIGLAAVVFVGFVYGRARAADDGSIDLALPEDAPVSLTVTISSPGSGQTVPNGSPVGVEVLVQSSEAVAAIELWADDDVVGHEVVPAVGGPTTIGRSFWWLPAGPGLHTLRARAVSASGASGESQVVWLFVDDVGLLGQILDPTNDVSVQPAATGGGVGGEFTAADLVGVDPPAPFDPPGLPGPGSAVEAATSLEGVEVWAMAPTRSGGPPQAPALAGEAGAGCVALLYIYDMSDDEQGFRIYRHSLADPDGGLLVAEIDGSDSGLAIGVVDAVPVGAVYTYVAESFNEHGAFGLSNPVSLDLIQAGCAPPEPPPLVSLLPTSISLPPGIGSPGEGEGDDSPSNGGGPGGVADIPFDAGGIVFQAYCYVGDGGSTWSRYPAVDFMDVDREGDIDPADHLGRALTSMDDAPVPSGTWDCWGWTAGDLAHVGTFEFGGASPRTSPPPASDPLTLGELNLQPKPVGVFTGLGTNDLSPGFPDIGFHYDPVSADPTMVAPRLFHSIDTLDCLLHKPASADGYAHCHPGHWHSKFTDTSSDFFVPVEDHAHAYLFWDLADSGNCSAGTGCVAPGDVSALPFSVVDSGFRIYDMFASQTEPIATLPLGSSGFVPVAKGCGVTRAFEVRSFVETSQPMTFESRTPLSFVGFQEPCTALDTVQIEVVFDTLTLADVDDGFLAEADLELYGDLTAAGLGGGTADGSAGGLEVGYSADFHYSTATKSPSLTCDLEVIDLQGQQEQANFAGCPQIRGEGSHTVWGLSMTCVGFGYHASRCPATTTGVSPRGGRVHLELDDATDAIRITVDLWDYDHASPDDPVCQGSITVAKEPFESWADRFGESWAIGQGFNGSATCTISGHLEAVPENWPYGE